MASGDTIAKWIPTLVYFEEGMYSKSFGNYWDVVFGIALQRMTGWGNEIKVLPLVKTDRNLIATDVIVKSYNSSGLILIDAPINIDRLLQLVQSRNHGPKSPKTIVYESLVKYGDYRPNVENIIDIWVPSYTSRTLYLEKANRIYDLFIKAWDQIFNKTSKTESSEISTFEDIQLTVDVKKFIHLI